MYIPSPEIEKVTLEKKFSCLLWGVCSKVLSFGNKNKKYFILYSAHLFVPLRRQKVCKSDNKTTLNL